MSSLIKLDVAELNAVMRFLASEKEGRKGMHDIRVEPHATEPDASVLVATNAVAIGIVRAEGSVRKPYNFNPRLDKELVKVISKGQGRVKIDSTKWMVRLRFQSGEKFVIPKSEWGFPIWRMAVPAAKSWESTPIGCINRMSALHKFMFDRNGKSWVKGREYHNLMIVRSADKERVKDRANKDKSDNAKDHSIVLNGDMPCFLGVTSGYAKPVIPKVALEFWI